MISLKDKKKTVGLFVRGGMGPEYEGKAQPIFIKLAESCQVPILPVKLKKDRIVFRQMIYCQNVANAQETAHQIMNYIDQSEKIP